MPRYGVEMEQIVGVKATAVSLGAQSSGLFDTPDGLNHGVVDEIVAGKNAAST